MILKILNAENTQALGENCQLVYREQYVSVRFKWPLRSRKVLHGPTKIEQKTCLYNVNISL
jgi:hypothetical protein